MDSPVLIVEPYADYRAEIVATLTRQHYRCDSVGSVADALLRVHDHAYRYLVVDVDQAHQADELIANASPGKVVLITDEDEREEDERYRVLRKPFDRNALLAILKS